MTSPRNTRRLLLMLLSGVTAAPTGPCEVVCDEGGCVNPGGGAANDPPRVEERIHVQARNPRNSLHGRTRDVARVDWQTIFELRSSDPDGDQVLTEWDLNGDGNFEQGGLGDTRPLGGSDPDEPVAPGERVTTYYHAPGTTQVTARVSDFPKFTGAPGEVTRTKLLYIVDDAAVEANQPPRDVGFNVFPPSPRAGQEAAFEGTASDPDPYGDEFFWDWRFGDGTSSGGQAGEDRVTHRYENPGTYEVVLDVFDGIGARGYAVRTITVREANAANTAPRASFVVRPPAPAVGQEATFDASASSDAEGRIIRYEWDLDGNGTYEVASSQPTTSTSYGSPGERLVGLQVTDGGGATDVERRAVNVRAEPGFALRIGGPVFPAAAARLRFSARVDGALRRGTRGKGANGDVRAQFVEPAGSGQARAARRLRPFFDARWRMRISRKLDRRSGRVTASGVAFARPRRGRRSAVCIRLRLDAAPGKVPEGSLTLLGGTGSAARLRGSARFVFRLEADGTGTVLGPIGVREGRARPLPRACRPLAR